LEFPLLGEIQAEALMRKQKKQPHRRILARSPERGKENPIQEMASSQQIEVPKGPKQLEALK